MYANIEMVLGDNHKCVNIYSNWWEFWQLFAKFYAGSRWYVVRCDLVNNGWRIDQAGEGSIDIMITFHQSSDWIKETSHTITQWEVHSGSITGTERVRRWRKGETMTAWSSLEGLKSVDSTDFNTYNDDQAVSMMILNFLFERGQFWTPILQIPQCTCPISHNTPFRTEMSTFLFWMVYYGIWDKCIVGLVRLVD